MKHVYKLFIVSFIIISFLIVGLPSNSLAKGKVKTLIITTATTGGTYYPVGVALATLWTIKLVKKQKIRVNAITSAGSGENVNMLKNKEAELAILQGLFGSMAWNGTLIYKGKPFKDLRTITMLWPNVEHFVLVKNKVKTGTIIDIKGTRFSIGRAGSGTERSTLTIMSAFGMDRKSVKAEYLGYTESANAIKNKKIDGASLCAGPPVSAVTNLFATPGVHIKILEFTDEQLKTVQTKSAYPAFRYIIPANTYPGQKKAIKSIAQPNFLGVRKDLDEKTVYLLTKTIFENLPYLINIHKACRFISLDSAVNGLPAPLHPGAYKYYKEKGIPVAKEIIPPEIK